MNDHNLDDLIIDNIEPKNSKTKSFLTIIALLIVVLIVAIILTKIILKNPDSQRIALEENNTELISPELTLQSVTETPKPKVQEPKAPVPAPKVVKETVEPVAPVVTAPKVEKKAPETVKITDEFSQQPVKPDPKEVERKRLAEEKAKQEAQKKAQAAEKAKQAEAQKQKELEAKRLAEEKAKQQAAQSVVKGAYYIQVGSFTKTPSSRFLSVITNSGFNYKITAPTAAGTKKLLIGPYKDRESANNALVRVKDRINKSAFVVKK